MADEQSGDRYVVVARRYRPQGFDELVGQGQVSQALLDSVLGLQRRKKQDAPLGELLVSLGVVSADKVRAILKQQCVAVLRHCLAAESGTFNFAPNIIDDGDVAARFDVDELLALALEEGAA